MTAPNWESLEDDEKFKVMRELRYTLIWSNAARCSMSSMRLHWMYTRDGNTPCTNITRSTAPLVSQRSSTQGRTSRNGWSTTLSHRSIREGLRRTKVIVRRKCTITIRVLVRMKQLALDVITEAHLQNPDTPIEQMSPLSLDTEISISDKCWGRRAGKEDRALGRAVHRELSQDSTSTRRSMAAEAQEQVREAIEKARVAEEEARACRSEVLEVWTENVHIKAQLSTMMDFLNSMGMPNSSCQRNDSPKDSTTEDDDPNNGGIDNLQTPGNVDMAV